MAILNLFLIFRLLYMATVYVVKKNVRLSQFRIYEGEFPDRLRSARQQYQNMFEIPILFYLLCLLQIFFNNYTQIDILLAWGFSDFPSLTFFYKNSESKKCKYNTRTIVFVISLVFLTIAWIKFMVNTL